MILSPGVSVVTLGPRATTSPATSVPGTNGKRSGSRCLARPSWMCQSTEFTLLAFTLTSTSPFPGAGTGTSTYCTMPQIHHRHHHRHDLRRHSLNTLIDLQKRHAYLQSFAAAVVLGVLHLQHGRCNYPFHSLVENLEP